MRVAGFGEIMLRLSTTKGTTFKQSNNFNVNYGGGEANVLISLSNFDIDTRMITKVSNDDIGKSIIKYLKSIQCQRIEGLFQDMIIIKKISFLRICLLKYLNFLQIFFIKLFK